MRARIVLFVLFFASGFAGLVYESLWLRELALVFGNTAEAAATTLAAYFLGMAAGQHIGGRRAGAWPSLRAYGLLELAVAASGVLALFLLSAYRTFYPRLFAALAGQGIAFEAATLGLALVVLFVPAACMGATLPVLGRYLVRRAPELASTFGLLYALQTIGGACGVLAAGFVLPPMVGLRATYAVAVAISAAVGCVALVLARAEVPEPAARDIALGQRLRRLAKSGAHTVALSIALLSGFATLAIEVLWTQMFARVLHNSVYSFAAVLLTFLFALGLGGLIARALARRPDIRPPSALSALLLACAIAVAGASFVFHAWTGGLAYLESGEGWEAYVRSILAASVAVMLLPGAVIGSVFPYLLKLEENATDAGATIGRLAAVNTIGAVAGSIAAGFGMLPWLGLWSSMRAIALLYTLAALAVGATDRGAAHWRPALPMGALFLLLTVLDPTRLPAAHLEPEETLVDLFEGASGTVSVVRRGELLSIKLDGHYSLGANGAVANDRRQGELPLLLHPAPRSVFFLGMGTGITAGAALFHPLERVTTCELVPDVVTAAHRHFAPYVNGLFDDPRSRVVIGDGRSYLLGTAERYDVIIADLFVPWHAGTGTLYTREHYAAARDRLTENGLYAQWLPLYQMSRRELAVVVRTMAEVFPQVTLWRGDFLPRTPVVALIGHVTPSPLDLDAAVANVRKRQGGAEYPEDRARALTMMFYAGNAGAARSLFAAAPANTDDDSAIEYLAPVTQREVAAGRASWLTGDELVRFYDEVAAVVPLERDPYLARLNEAEVDFARAGRELYLASVDQDGARGEDAHRHFEEFARRVPAGVAQAFAGMVESGDRTPSGPHAGDGAP